MTDIKNQINAIMKRVRTKGELPASATVVKQAFERLGYVSGQISSEEILANFNNTLRKVWEESLVVLEEHEERSYAKGIPSELAEHYPRELEKAESVAEMRGFREGMIQLFELWYPMLRRCFLSVSQSRKQRGGKDFELQIEQLFELVHIPYHKQETQNRTDLILPDLKTHIQNRTASAIVSVKRTLRERWAEVAEELFNLRSPNVFLFTADEEVTARHVSRICGDYNIHLVVWDAVKSGKYPDEPLVLGYTAWVGERLTLLRQRWPKP
jgi:hypothetical protein